MSLTGLIPPDVSLNAAIAICAIAFVSGTARGFSGFGSALIFMPLASSMAAPQLVAAVLLIIDFIAGLVARGFAYASGGDVYYRVRNYPDYGKLSKRDIDDLSSGARVDQSELKDDPLDFALWKAAKPGEPSWDSPWGPGRPGWHIECSAMALKELGEQIDVHGGGADLIFPHHSNEIAQTEAFTGKPPFAKIWMHNALLQLGEEKMSKSLGNLVFVHDLLEAHDARAVRLAVVGHHYRDSWEWTDGLMPAATERLGRWADAGSGDGALDEVRLALDDDLDTPAAAAAIDAAAAAGHGVASAAALLGVILYD